MLYWEQQNRKGGRSRGSIIEEIRIQHLIAVVDAVLDGLADAIQTLLVHGDALYTTTRI